MDLFGHPDAPEAEDIEDDDIPSVLPPSNDMEAPFQAPRLMNRISGHETIEQDLLRLYNENRMPHGLIFSGIKGIGKATMAYRLARFLFKNGLPPDPNQGGLFGDAPASATSMDVKREDRAFAWVAQNAHPDFLAIERAYDETKDRYKASVEVDEVRKITPFLRMTSSEGGWRVVIIDDADTMNRNAQNGLLKILEEPPPNTVLILVTHRLGALIPTIRSRSRVIQFSALTQAVLERELDCITITPREKSKLVELCGGSLGRALYFTQLGGLETLEQALGAFHGYPSFAWSKLHKLSDDLLRSDQDNVFQGFAESMVWIFETLARQKARGAGLQSPILRDQPVFEAILRNSSLEQLVKTCENLQSHFDRVQAANLDKRQGVLGAFSLIAASLN